LNTRSGRLMILGFMLLFFAFVLTLLLQVLVVNFSRVFFPEWAGLSALCVAVIVIAALAGIVAGVLGFRSDR
jgi:hypothetical protein